MIGWFPSPYPDELFYSICARYDALVAFRSRSAGTIQLTGQQKSKVIIDLPCNLRRFTSSLPPNNYYTVDQIIDKHSLLNFYAPFLPPERVTRIRNEMGESNGNLVHKILGSIHFAIKNPRWLRYCPVCIKSDKSQYGEAHWHRLHQVAGVEVCLSHEVFLKSSNIGRRSYKGLFCINQLTKSHQGYPLRKVNHAHQAYLDIARDVAWLLSQPSPALGLKSLEVGCATILNENGFRTPDGKTRTRELSKALRKFYPAEFLSSLHSSIDGHSKRPWINRFIESLFNHHFIHPLHFLLIAQYFGFNAQSFIQKCKDTGAENPATYLFHRGQRKTYGAKWEAALVQMWGDNSFYMRDIEEQLGVNFETVKRHAVRLGLSLPRVGPTKRGNPRSTIERIRVCRQKWIIALEQHPNATRTALRNKIGQRAHHCLRTCDNEWLQAHMPSPPVKDQSRLRKNWMERDVKLEEQVLHAASSLKRIDGCPLWVNKSAIARLLESPNQLENLTLAKMPLTIRALETVTESYSDYVLRKIDWATRRCRDRGLSPSIRQFLHQAQLHSGFLSQMPEFQSVVESAVVFLRNPASGHLEGEAAA